MCMCLFKKHRLCRFRQAELGRVPICEESKKVRLKVKLYYLLYMNIYYVRESCHPQVSAAVASRSSAGHLQSEIFDPKTVDAMLLAMWHHVGYSALFSAQASGKFFLYKIV